MKSAGLGYIFAGLAGVTFFTAATVDRAQERIKLERCEPGFLFTIPGEVESVDEKVGFQKQLVIKLRTDTMAFVGREGYPKLYEFGAETLAHLKPGSRVIVQVENETYLTHRIKAQRGGSNEIEIASLTSTEPLLKIEKYLEWRKRGVLSGLFLMPSLSLFCLWLVLVGWQQRFQGKSRIYQPFFGSRARA